MSAIVTRRDFLRTGAGLGAASLLAGAEVLSGQDSAQAPAVVMASENGLQAVSKAMELLRTGVDPVDAVVAGVNIVEDDPEETGVGYGGLPNEEGVVELDASVMHGPTHKCGGVAGLRNIKNPSRVAKLVMERTDHVLLVGEGALKFARAHGFPEENLLTERARRIWLEWKENLSDKDDWVPAKKEISTDLRQAMDTFGTINCLARDANGDLAGVTTTSGLSFKIPGRVGDSPIIGAGLYVDNQVGAAGSTGRGEANLATCASFTVVQFIEKGLSPEEACLRTLEKVFQKTRLQPRLLDKEGRPWFDLTFYALNKKGEYGSASMWSGAEYAVHDGKGSRLAECAYLFKRKE